ncbi:Alw26I/Eco31I/Esp3I family type II restriction endonuclease [Billgrantia antri]|uniref:Alw26I/Eco31I/Esp3I family type II restriction endonuclease n=1 Tax=Billgrantia antri TaxID=2846777 RepID=UPI003B20C570
MSPTKNIIDDFKEYGRKGQEWHPAFVAYMVEIVTHPVYEGMPDAINQDGKIQWEAPSNRSSGQFQFTHHRRRCWWYDKALSIGVDPATNKWISKVAKKIHPTGMKPCKRCGREMRIAYVYPNDRLRQRLLRAFSENFEFVPLEPITDLIQRIADQYGVDALSNFHSILSDTKEASPPESIEGVDAWSSWLEDYYIPSEPALLSPGAMSNAPDRFDGFHSFNLCCRKNADTGRHDSNMRSYTTDRRVFEYWSDGDWIAADRMMGIISALMREEPCADGRDGPPTPDHIGPLSLGFAHRPHFRLLSRSANSAKNNRMTLADVTDLIAAESSGEEVASWHAKPLWDLRKSAVTSEELALRMSKMLRDNQRAAMHMLVEVFRTGHLTFLASLLGLEHANYHVEFENLRVERFIPVFDAVKHTPRLTKYAAEQKARRLRIGLEALRAYGEKENRHASIIPEIALRGGVIHPAASLRALNSARETVQQLDEELNSALCTSNAQIGEQELRRLSSLIPVLSDEKAFIEARSQLIKTMSSVATVLSGMWESDRYVRSTFEEIDNE